MEDNPWTDLDSSSKRTWVEKYSLEKIWEMVRTSPGLTKTQLEEDYNAIKRTPVYDPEAIETGKVGGKFVPTVFILEALALSDIEAITEILDGIIENHQNWGEKDRITNIEIRKQHQAGSKPEIVIEENSGGIKFDSLDSIVTLGKSDWGELYGVGVFGVGLKKALRYLGETHEIFTYHQDEKQGSQIKLTSDYWSEIGTSVETVRSYDGEKGTTQIVVKSLTEHGEALEFNEELIEKFAIIYGNWLERVPGTINISFKNPGEEKIPLNPKSWLNKSLIKAKYSKFPGFEPKMFTLVIPEGKGIIGKVKANMTFGLTLVGNPDKCGVTVAGNNRIFSIGNKQKFWGFDQESSYGKIGKISGAYSSRFHCFIDIVAREAIDIPWNVGQKMGYNHNHPLHKYLHKAVQCAAKPYMDFDRIAKDRDIQSFSFSENAKVIIPQISFSKANKGDSHEDWNFDDMETMKEALRKVLNSKDEAIISEFYLDLGAEEETSEELVGKTDSKTPKKSDRKSEKQPLTTKEAVKSIQKYKDLKREDRKSAQFNGNFLPKTLRAFLEKSEFLEHEQMVYPQGTKRAGKPKPVRVIEELFFHFLKTKDLHKPEDFPENFDKWIESFEPEESE